MLYHVGDSCHTKNIQISKVIGENEKCVFYFMEKSKQTFGQPSIWSNIILVSRTVSLSGCF